LLEQRRELLPVQLAGRQAAGPALRSLGDGVLGAPAVVREGVEVGARVGRCCGAGCCSGGRDQQQACADPHAAGRAHADALRRPATRGKVASTAAVSTTAANSRCRSARATAWICSAGYSTPSGPTRSNVAVASETTHVANPRLPAMRAVVETQ